VSVEDEFDPAEVARIVADALRENQILPMTFIETQVFERLTHLLQRYMPYTDVVYAISELKQDLMSGFTRMSSQELHTLVSNCIRCGNLVDGNPVLPSWNRTDPDLMLIAENPASMSQHMALLTTGLKAAGFSSQRCTLTYLTRCPTRTPDPVVVKNCIPYLHTEIAIMNPKLIITLGMSVYTALTGDHTSRLNDIKNTVMWLGPYPIIPEMSLAASAHSQEKSQSINSLMSYSFTTAYQFLYGGR
jgi:uracil-DNA glycosylase family 4